MVRETAEKALLRLAEQSAASWRTMRGDAFAGATMIETANTLYRFKDGFFTGRAAKPVEREALRWQLPPWMVGIELVGFLAYEDSLWRLSSRWKAGALAVMARLTSPSDGAFTLTSPVLACTITKMPTIERRHRLAPERSDVFAVRTSRPPSVRRPAPSSMTRVQPAPECD